MRRSYINTPLYVTITSDSVIDHLLRLVDFKKHKYLHTLPSCFDEAACKEMSFSQGDVAPDPFELYTPGGGKIRFVVTDVWAQIPVLVPVSILLGF
jgi:hypothetical protein